MKTGFHVWNYCIIFFVMVGPRLETTPDQHSQLGNKPDNQEWGLEGPISPVLIFNKLATSDSIMGVSGTDSKGYRHMTGTGSVRWIISESVRHMHMDYQRHHIWQPHHRVYGNSQSSSQFNSKAAGQYELLLTFHYLLKEHSKTKGSITVACDGQSVLDRLPSSKTIDPFVAHYDLLWACKNILKQL